MVLTELILGNFSVGCQEYFLRKMTNLLKQFIFFTTLRQELIYSACVHKPSFTKGIFYLWEGVRIAVKSFRFTHWKILKVEDILSF